jgi:hypothetical protein
MQCTGVWFAGGKFGLSWKAVQVRLDSVPASLGRGPAFKSDEDEDDAPFVSAGGAAFAEPAEFSRPAAFAATAAAPADADADEDEEVAPPPVPKPSKMTVKKVLGPPKK